MPEDSPSTLDEHDEPAVSSSRGPGSLGVVWVFPRLGLPVLRLGQADVVIGRGEHCGCTLDGALISREHARIRRLGRNTLIEDLGSRNGISVNGEAVTQRALGRGDVLRLGEWIGVVRQLAPDDEVAFGEIAPGLFGGPELRRALEPARAAAPSELPVVIQGETGTGKERVARALHEWSGRRGPCLAVNCATYTTSTAAAELFGYRRGAFTGANRAHEGHVRAAQGGTLVLDEIADLSADVQTNLLRAIEQREVLPLGESRSISVDVRFVATTQEPLSREVERGRFRADLRARLEAFVVELPPLRERRSEIAPLFAYFLKVHANGARLPELDARAVERLCVYDWPLNVRELELLARRALARSRSEGFTLRYAEELHPPLKPAARSAPAAQGKREPAPGSRPEPRPLLPAEIEALLAALERHGQSLARAAQELGISRHRAYRLLKAARLSRQNPA